MVSSRSYSFLDIFLKYFSEDPVTFFNNTSQLLIFCPHFDIGFKHQVAVDMIRIFAFELIQASSYPIQHQFRYCGNLNELHPRSMVNSFVVREAQRIFIKPKGKSLPLAFLIPSDSSGMARAKAINSLLVIINNFHKARIDNGQVTIGKIIDFFGRKFTEPVYMAHRYD